MSSSGNSDLGYESTSSQLGQWDREFLWHPFAFLREWLSPEFEVPVLVKGEGAYLYEAGGRRLIDGNASIWCNVHGHGHPRILAAVRDQLERFAHTSFLGFSHPPGIVLARRLIEEHLGPWGFRRVFFSESGSNAIEAALRMALQWQILTGHPERQRFVAFRRSYHGDSLGASSVTGLAAFKAFLGGSGYAVTWLNEPAELGDLHDARNIAGLILEPVIAGAAAMVPWPGDTLGRCREWCDRHGALLLHDEVFTGFGRTGKMFGFEHEACPADILILGKGLSGGVGPLSATVVTERVFQPFAAAPTIEENFLYGHSYAAHAVACAGGIASLDVFAEERVIERLAGPIASLADVLHDLSLRPEVKEVRCRGFAAAVEVAATGGSEEFVQTSYGRSLGRVVTRECWNLGLAVRAIGNSIILVLPLCATDEVIRETGAILGDAIGRTVGRF
jgi:adenosylmethionine-8-amino-7-oxononanoate aminotransferase